jgi:DNA polymerase-3 subunit beta
MAQEPIRIVVECEGGLVRNVYSSLLSVEVFVIDWDTAECFATHEQFRASPLTLTAGDLDVGVITSVPAEVTESGRTTVRARLLDEYVAALPPESLRLRLGEGGTRLRATSGRFSAGFPVTDPTEIPEPPAFEEGEAFAVAADALRTGIARVAFAAARDDLRSALKGIHCRFDAEGLRLTASDGFRLARARVPGAPGAAAEAILPARAAAEFARLLAGGGAALLALSSDRCMHLLAGDTVLFARLLEGPFPDTDRVSPTKWRTRVRIEWGALRQALGVAGLFWSGDGGRPLQVEASTDELRLSAQGLEAGDAQAALPATVEGGAQCVALSTPYLAEILDAVEGPHVELVWQTPVTPMVVREVGQEESKDLWILMPTMTVETARPAAPVTERMTLSKRQDYGSKSKVFSEAWCLPEKAPSFAARRLAVRLSFQRDSRPDHGSSPEPVRGAVHVIARSGSGPGRPTYGSTAAKLWV